MGLGLERAMKLARPLNINLRLLAREERERRRMRKKGSIGALYGYDGVVAVVVVLLRLSLVTSAATESEQLSSRECENLGFTGLALCSDCNTLSEYVKDKDLVSDCFKCCTEDSNDATTKITYSGALLEVCMRKLVFYPEVVSFIEDEKDQFPSVKVQYVFNSPPKLIMLDDAGQHKETIRVDNWKREHILQFLREKLKPLAAE